MIEQNGCVINYHGSIKYSNHLIYLKDQNDCSPVLLKPSLAVVTYKTFWSCHHYLLGLESRLYPPPPFVQPIYLPNFFIYFFVKSKSNLLFHKQNKIKK